MCLTCEQLHSMAEQRIPGTRAAAPVRRSRPPRARSRSGRRWGPAASALRCRLSPPGTPANMAVQLKGVRCALAGERPQVGAPAQFFFFFFFCHTPAAWPASRPTRKERVRALCRPGVTGKDRGVTRGLRLAPNALPTWHARPSCSQLHRSAGAAVARRKQGYGSTVPVTGLRGAFRATAANPDASSDYRQLWYVPGESLKHPISVCLRMPVRPALAISCWQDQVSPSRLSILP